MRNSYPAVAILAALIAMQSAQPALAAPGFTATLSATPATYGGKCPATIKLDGQIVNTPDYVSSVKYSLLNSDGIDSFLMTATFDATHTFAVHDGRTPNASGTYWVQILIHNADNRIIARSNQARFIVRCIGEPNPNGTQPSTSQTPCVPGFAPCPSPKPNPTPTRCLTPAGAPCPQETPHPQKTPPCPPSLTAVAINRCLPDLTAARPVSVGGHSTVWGAGVTLTDADAIAPPSTQNPYCAFRIVYTVKNLTAFAAGPPPFKDILRVEFLPVSIQSGLTLGGLASQTITTDAYLPPGVHHLTLDINPAPHAFPEVTFGNNHFSLKYQLTGNCKRKG